MGMPRKTDRRFRDNADWFPFFRKYQGGASLEAVAQEAGRSKNWTARCLRRLAALDEDQLRALREVALQRLVARADAELMLGSPAEAARLAAGITAMAKAIEAEKQSRETMSDNTQDDTTDPGDHQALRREVRRKYIERALVFRRAARLEKGGGCQPVRPPHAGAGLEPAREPDPPARGVAHLAVPGRPRRGQDPGGG